MVVQAIDMSCYKILPLIQNNASKGGIRNEDQYKYIWMQNSPAEECHAPIEGWNP